MSTPMEQRQRENDRAFGLHETRMMNRARFGSPLSADLFELGTSAAQEVAASVDKMSDEEAARRRRIAEADEVVSEGRAHVNTRTQRHE